MALTLASGRRADPHATADDAVHDTFMTLPAYSRSKEGEGHELGFGVRNGSHTARCASRGIIRLLREFDDSSTRSDAVNVVVHWLVKDTDVIPIVESRSDVIEDA